MISPVGIRVVEAPASHPSYAAPGWASPLREIELAVQARAKSESIDMGEDGAVERLRTIVAEEVATWRREFRRGRRPVDLADPDAAVDRAVRNLIGYGPLEPLIADPDVWEIMINGPASIFTKRHSGQSGYHNEVFHDDDHVVRVLTKVLDDAGRSHRKLDPAEGLQDAQLNDGARIHIVHSDIARDGHLLVNIRKFSGLAHRHMSELIERGMLDRAAAQFLQACVRSGLSIIVAGAPGAGKTTLLSCLAAELDPALRVVVAEEVFETDIPLANIAQMQTRPARQDRAEVDLRRLVAGFLRMAPDVAIVGEVRDREGLSRLPSSPFRSRICRSRPWSRDRSAGARGPFLRFGASTSTRSCAARSLCAANAGCQRFRQRSCQHSVSTIVV